MPWAATTCIKQMYEKAYEGHVRQYTAAKTTDVPFAKEGMYYKEFPSQFDWQHNGEGLTVFNLMPLGDPYSRALSRAGASASPASTWTKIPARPTTIPSSS